MKIVLMIVFILLMLALLFTDKSVGAETPKMNHDGSVTIAGENVKCRDYRIILDRRLDNLGMSDPGAREITLNPDEFSKYYGPVQLFVFAHECGHANVGMSETGSDCWAVKKGIEGGWLTRKTMVWVCRSFGNSPAFGPYPSGAKRCALIQQCYAKYKAERKKT